MPFSAYELHVVLVILSFYQFRTTYVIDIKLFSRKSGTLWSRLASKIRFSFGSRPTTTSRKTKFRPTRRRRPPTTSSRSAIWHCVDSNIFNVEFGDMLWTERGIGISIVNVSLERLCWSILQKHGSLSRQEPYQPTE